MSGRWVIVADSEILTRPLKLKQSAPTPTPTPLTKTKNTPSLHLRIYYFFSPITTIHQVTEQSATPVLSTIDRLIPDIMGVLLFRRVA